MAGVYTSGQPESSTTACGSITRRMVKVILSGSMVPGSTRVPSKMTRDTVRESTLGTTAPNRTEGSGVMARKMEWGTCVIISTLLRKKDSGGVTKLSNGYRKEMMTRVKMEIASSAKTSLIGKMTQISLIFLNQRYRV